MRKYKLKTTIKSNNKFMFNLYSPIPFKDIEVWLATHYAFNNLKKFTL